MFCTIWTIRSIGLMMDSVRRVISRLLASNNIVYYTIYSLFFLVMGQ